MRSPAAAVVVVFALFLGAPHLAHPGAARAAQASPGKLPILAVDPLPSGTVLENHADALAHWVRKGLAGAVLLHIDAHDDLRPIEEGRLGALKALRDRGDLKALTDAGRGGSTALYNEWNLVRAAAALGIFREVVWVMPYPYLGGPDADARLREHLGRVGFTEAEVASFRRAGGCYHGAVEALPVRVCAQEQLPPIGEPVALSLNIDYLPPAALSRTITPLAEISSLAAALRAARYEVRDSVVVYSVLSGEVPVDLRWVGEAIIDVLREPGLAQQPEPPERWSMLQRLRVLRVAGAAKEGELLNIALSLIEQQPHDPALMVFAALASATHGGGEASLAYAEQACRTSRGYCVGLREVGLQLLERGAVDQALALLAAGDRLLPGMVYGRLQEGLLLARAGRPVEALAAYEKAMAYEGAFPAGFLAGAVQAASGNRAAARSSYDAALAALTGQSNATGTSAEVAAAIRGAASFYRAEGLEGEAERLERHPLLQSTTEGGGR